MEFSKNASQLVPIVEKSGKFRDTHYVGTIITETIGEKFTINTAVGTKIMIQITSRDKKVLFAGGTFIVFWLLFILVAQPACTRKIKEQIKKYRTNYCSFKNAMKF